MIESSRRGFITGLISLVAAPAIVRAGSLMPVKAIIITPYEHWITRISRERALTPDLYGDSPAMQALRLLAEARLKGPDTFLPIRRLA